MGGILLYKPKIGGILVANTTVINSKDLHAKGIILLYKNKIGGIFVANTTVIESNKDNEGRGAFGLLALLE